jgi:NADPH:quinone reductase-like Zn-dependent oxidoreductase
MHANGAQLRELAALYDAGHLRAVVDETFPFDRTLEALAYAEQGRANGKVVITLHRQPSTPPITSGRSWPAA